MDARDCRMKASDVFNASQSLFGRTSEFSAGFPGIKSVTATVSEFNWDDPDRSRVSTYTERTFREYVDCHNSQCYNGGVHLGGLLRSMGYAQQTQAEFNESCQGYEGTPKGRKNYGPCEHYFKVQIDVVYE